MADVLQTIATPLAILIVGFFNYRLVSRGIEQMKEASDARMKRDDQRHTEVMATLRGSHEATMATLQGSQEATMAALHELIERTGIASRPG